MDIQVLLSILDNVKPHANGSYYTARCPGHEDHQNSLSVREGADGRILVKCFTGCDLERILTPLSLKPSDLFKEHEHTPNTGTGKGSYKEVSQERAWDLLDIDGTVAATHCRIDYTDGTKRYYWKRNGALGLGGYRTARLPLYGLKYLNGQSGMCILTEGEKAADALNQAGYLAFGTVCGASSTPDEAVLDILTYFHTIYLWPDFDKPGIEHMQRIAGILTDMGITPYIIDWSDAPQKGDAADYIQAQLPVDALLQSAVIWPPPKTDVDTLDDPHRFSLTDTGNAERFVRDHGDVLRYCPERDRWLLWNGRHWEWCDRARTKVMELAKQTVRGIYREASEVTDDALRADFGKHARRSESEQRRKAMIALAQSEPGIPISFNSLDQKHWLLNCANGTVDLETATIKEHDRNDLITVCIPYEYHEHASAPTWTWFLEQICCQDNDLQHYLHKAVGYSITGDTTEQCLFFLYGGGNNGKSTFVNTLLEIIGAYGHEVSTDVFMIKDRGNSGPKEGLANLQGKRLVAATELEEGQRLATATVKMATGGEKITADRKHEHEISFWPTHKLWFSGNHKPRISDTTDSIWRRVKLIPFNLKLSKSEIDYDLKTRLLNEAQGILTWIVLGAALWRSQRLEEPSIVERATSRYRSNEDKLVDFLSERCEVSLASNRCYVADLYREYQEWCHANGEKPFGKQRFNERLEEKGFIKTRGGSNKMEWNGIGVLMR